MRNPTPAVLPTSALSTELADLAKEAREYLACATAANTRRARTADANIFTTWCTSHARSSLPASSETLALFLTAMAKQRKTSTLERYLATISQMHELAGHESPTRTLAIRKLWRGIRNTHGTAPKTKTPIRIAELRALLTTLPASLAGQRDRALLLVGFAGAFRRSELVALNLGDLAFSGEGVVLTIRRSKTDQEGAGRVIAIPFGRQLDTCPVRALQTWIAVANLTGGAVFRPVNRHAQVLNHRLTSQSIALVVKRAAMAAKLDPDRFSGHSLRAGFATSSAAAGTPERDIMRQTGHKNVTMLRRYIRDGELFRDNPVARLGL